MLRNNTILLLLLFCNIWLSCNATFKLQHIVEHVNRANVPWEAGINQLGTSDYKNIVGTWGFQKNGKEIDIIGRKDNNHGTDDGSNDMPETFDARNKWFECVSIAHIWNQGNCAADWAISVTSAINDRICIKSKKNITVLYSPQKLLSCCDDCGDGCNGGYSGAAWQYWMKRGLVTGGDYGSNEGCQPWLIPPCNHTVMDERSPSYMCGKYKSETPKCNLNCYNPNYSKPFLKDISKGVRIDWNCPGTIRNELKKHGPATAIMRVYEDFLTYKSGIYQHVTGKLLGQITVKVIGWGVNRGVQYWLAANSWGTSWGDKGFFKIRRGSNECLFEDYFISGRPVL
ncbi:cathepsin B-like [Myzus persicae]|uniref:Cathepsin B-10270 n=1 Tax=Myzus persicae TaxID=13164 RepID=A0AA51N2N3_MYZPE|nr:cathepsin B-like [Myzus persicae]WMM65065.1 cathepsin B-10270 [Myzus persicae]